MLCQQLAWDEKSTWTFFEQGGKVVAKIDDQEFWQKVHQRAVAFREGDSLRVRLRWEVIEKNHKLVQQNSILKVYQVTTRPKQMRLDGGNDDEVTAQRPVRKFRLDDE